MNTKVKKLPIEMVEFEKAAKPLMLYLANNHHPHMTVIVTATSAELVEGQMMAKNDILRD